MDLSLARYEDSEFRHWGVDVVEGGLSEVETLLVRRHLGDPKASILEVGCGGGRVCLALAKSGYRRVCGIDFSAKFIELATEHARQAGVTCEFKTGDARSVPYSPGTFDGVLLFANVINFIAPEEQREQVFEEVARVLKPGGILLMSSLLFTHRRLNRVLSCVLSGIRRLHNPCRHTSQHLPWLKKGGKPNLSFWRSGEAQVYWYRKAELIEHLERCGFMILEQVDTHEVGGGRRAADGDVFLAARRMTP